MIYSSHQWCVPILLCGPFLQTAFASIQNSFNHKCQFVLSTSVCLHGFMRSKFSHRPKSIMVHVNPLQTFVFRPQFVTMPGKNLYNSSLKQLDGERLRCFDLYKRCPNTVESSSFSRQQVQFFPLCLGGRSNKLRLFHSAGLTSGRISDIMLQPNMQRAAISCKIPQPAFQKHLLNPMRFSMLNLRAVQPNV